MMGGRNLRRKCEAVLEYTKMKSAEMPHVNICRLTEGSPIQSGVARRLCSVPSSLVENLCCGKENTRRDEGVFWTCDDNMHVLIV